MSSSIVYGDGDVTAVSAANEQLHSPSLHPHEPYEPPLAFAVAIECSRHRGIGPLLRSSVAMGAALVCIVGSPDFGTHGAHGSQRHVHTVHFFTWKECVDHMRARGYATVALSPSCCVTHSADSAKEVILEETVAEDGGGGDKCTANFDDAEVEIKNHSNYNDNDIKSQHEPYLPLETFEFAKQSTMFLLGFNDRLTKEIVDVSDSIIYCTFPNQAMERGIKYEAKLAICLLHFTKSFPSVYNQQTFVGEKFIVGDTIGFNAGSNQGGREGVGCGGGGNFSPFSSLIEREKREKRKTSQLSYNASTGEDEDVDGVNMMVGSIFFTSDEV